MPLSIGETAPDFRAETTHGSISFHEWMGNSWCVLFSHPKDFTPVCTTELGYIARIKPEFDRRGVKIVGLSVDSVENHAKWSNDIAAVAGVAPNYPMIGDTDLTVAKLYGMLAASASGNSATRTPADNATVRTVYVIGPDKLVKAMIVYPMNTGRNFDEVLRLVELGAAHRQRKGRHPGQLEAGRGCDHPAGNPGSRGEGTIPRRLEVAAALHARRAAAARVNSTSDHGASGNRRAGTVPTRGWEIKTDEKYLSNSGIKPCRFKPCGLYRAQTVTLLHHFSLFVAKRPDPCAIG